MKKAPSQKIEEKQQELCVYAVMPFQECYCQSINGLNIPKITKYCMEANPDCPVFERIVTGKVKKAD